MKTNEFIKKAEELGYVVEREDCDFNVKYTDGTLICEVSKIEKNKIDTLYSKDVPTDLFDLCVEYARTPIDERKEEKRYKVRLVGLTLLGEQQLYLRNIGEIQASTTADKYTESELDEVAKTVPIHSEAYEIIEVEE